MAKAKEIFDPVLWLFLGSLVFGLWMLYDQSRKIVANVQQEGR